MKTRARSDRDKIDLRSSPVKLNGVGTPKSNARRSPVQPGDASPVRRQKKIAKVQDERMQFITKALNGYTGDLEQLFSVATWKMLIRKAKTGERKSSSDSAVESLAKRIIEQIISSEYSTKVGQVLSAPTARRGRGSPIDSDRATKFILLAHDFNNKQEDMVWKRANGQDYEEEDSRGSETSVISCDEEEYNNNNILPIPENNTVMMELEVEGLNLFFF